MAKFYPTIENISRLKVKPTEGEQHLLNYLEENLDDSYEVFFNPFLDGDRPDFIIIREGVAIFIIEVKDYNLDNYQVNSFKKWSVKYANRQSRISSPQSQAFTYKKNLYQLHLPVLGIGQLGNRNFFNLVQPFVYLHKADKDKVAALYQPAENDLRQRTSELLNAMHECSIDVDTYNRHAEGLSRTKKCIARDKAMIFSGEQAQKLVSKIKSYKSQVLFDDRVYDDLKRRLMPCEHVLKQGKA